jgi:hypothetical protein
MNLLFAKSYVLVGVGVGIAYAVFSILQINHFVGTLLRGDQYCFYYLIYLPTLLFFFCLYIARIQSFSNWKWLLIFGTITGHISGIIAYFAVIFFMGDGFVRIANSASDLEHFLYMLLVPFVYLGWAYGATTALSIYLLIGT